MVAVVGSATLIICVVVFVKVKRSKGEKELKGCPEGFDAEAKLDFIFFYLCREQNANGGRGGKFSYFK